MNVHLHGVNRLQTQILDKSISFKTRCGLWFQKSQPASPCFMAHSTTPTKAARREPTEVRRDSLPEFNEGVFISQSDVTVTECQRLEDAVTAQCKACATRRIGSVSQAARPRFKQRRRFRIDVWCNRELEY